MESGPQAVIPVRAHAQQPSSLSLALRRGLGRDWATAWLFSLPIVLVLIGLIAYPFFSAIMLSFQDKMVGRPGEWVGFANYTALLFGTESAGSMFRASLVNSFVYTFGSLLIKFVLGMAAALLLHERFWGRSLARAIVFLPWAIPSIIGAYAWQWVYMGSRFGFLNMLVLELGYSTDLVQWLANPDLAMISVIVAVSWAGMPFWAMLFLAGLQSIPQEVYEAASIDGANVFGRFRHVTLPGLSNVMAITFMLSTIWTANHLNFVYVLTGGGPGDSTMIFPMLAYQLGIASQRLSVGATVPLLFFPFFLILIYFLTKQMLASQR